jgi:hypothetical protein
VKVSKRTVAREWLIFLATFALGGPLIFFVAYYNSAEWGVDAWFAAIFLCFPLYLSVMLIRSIWWSIKLVNISKRARYGAAVFIAVIVAAAGGAIGIKNAVDRRRDVAKSESTPERTPELPPQAQQQDFDLGAFLAEETAAASRGEAADPRKIILFDVTYDDNRSPFDLFADITDRGARIKGRLRNELPRKIGRLKLTILFFNSDGKLIETQPVTIYGDFYPGGPTSFSGRMPRSLNLPENWTWKVTVSDAYYKVDPIASPTPNWEETTEVRKALAPTKAGESGASPRP